MYPISVSLLYVSANKETFNLDVKVCNCDSEMKRTTGKGALDLFVLFSETLILNETKKNPFHYHNY